MQVEELEALDMKGDQPKRLYIDILSYTGLRLLRVGNLEEGELSPPGDSGFERCQKTRVHGANHCLDCHTQELHRPLWDQEH